MHLELLPLLEREAALPLLLTPAASLVGVAHNRILVSVGVKTRVDVHRNLLLAGADVQCKATEHTNTTISALFSCLYTYFKNKLRVTYLEASGLATPTMVSVCPTLKDMFFMIRSCGEKKEGGWWWNSTLLCANTTRFVSASGRNQEASANSPDMCFRLNSTHSPSGQRFQLLFFFVLLLPWTL